MLRDRRVGLGVRLLALVMGGALTAAIISMELPVEGIVAALLNLPGIGLDLLVDGIEWLVAPVLFAALLLPHLAPRPLVDEQVPARRLTV